MLINKGDIMPARKANSQELDIILYPPTQNYTSTYPPPNNPTLPISPENPSGQYHWTPQFNCCGCAMMIVIALFLLWFFRGCG
jgi:hypothetical protein